MKIKSIAAICKKNKNIAIFERYSDDGDILTQYIGDGSAVYPVVGLPQLDKESISMGWLCVLAMVPLVSSLPTAAFLWLVAGGVIYTIGGIIYALKLPFFNARHQYFGSHEIFHLFVMGGSLCHFVVMFYIAYM